MRRSPLPIVLALVALVLPIAVSCSADAATATGGIRVRVVDDARQPLPGVSVTLSHDKALIATTTLTTDARGIAEFPVLRADGGYVVSVSLPGFATVTLPGTRVKPGEVTEVPVVMTSTSSLGEQVEITVDRDVVSAESPDIALWRASREPGPPASGRFYQKGIGLAPGSPVMDEPSTESYRRYDDSGFRDVLTDPLSTFSIDVDTASYANVRRFLEGGSLPPKDAVRIEELLNYFPYDLPGPRGADPFAVWTDVGTAPWAPEHRLMRVALEAREIDSSSRPAANLVFLVDVSGSMQPENKLPLLKRSFRMLLESLEPKDRVALVVYAGSSGLVLDSTPVTSSGAIAEALDRLEAGGSTNGGEGIVLAYRVAREHFVPGGINRVILATDGDFNVGVSSEGDLTRLVEREAKSGTFLTVLGFGMGNYKDSTLEALADRGNGNYAYIDSLLEARKALVEQTGGTLVTVAKDVKIQIEFNPVEVASYRLLGYENRLLAARDFDDDAKDAGEMGSGHVVTALYEIVPAGKGRGAPALEYQTSTPTDAAKSGEMATVKVRYKEPDGETSRLSSVTVLADQGVAPERAADFDFASSVACFGMLLRESEHRGEASWAMVRDLATRGLSWDPGGWRAQFLALAGKAEGME